MLQTTRGIVFNQVKYGETSIIAKIYTEQLGLQSYLIRGARSRKAKIRTAHLQHLTLIELEVNQRRNKEIQHLKSLKITYPFRDIPFNMKKGAVVIFLTEVLYKVIREEEPNQELFSFLYNAIQFLDLKEGNIGAFHYLFLIRLSKFLGFFPRDNFSKSIPNFDLQEGEFTAINGPDNRITKPPLSPLLHELLSLNFKGLDKVNIPFEMRNKMLEMILNYYQLHIPGLANIKSHLILSEVFNK